MRPFFNLIIFYHKFNQRQKQTPAPFAAFCLTESDNENVSSFQRELKCHSVFTHQAENECRCLDAKNHLNMQNHLNMHHNQLRHADGCGVWNSHQQQWGITWRCSCCQLHPCSPLDVVSHRSATPSFPGWVLNQRAAEQRQSPFPYPTVFQVNRPKSHEKTNFGLPLQGADIWKSILGKQTPSL